MKRGKSPAFLKALRKKYGLGEFKKTRKAKRRGRSVPLMKTRKRRRREQQRSGMF